MVKRKKQAERQPVIYRAIGWKGALDALKKDERLDFFSSYGSDCVSPNIDAGQDLLTNFLWPMFQELNSTGRKLPKRQRAQIALGMVLCANDAFSLNRGDWVSDLFSTDEGAFATFLVEFQTLLQVEESSSLCMAFFLRHMYIRINRSALRQTLISFTDGSSLAVFDDRSFEKWCEQHRALKQLVQHRNSGGALFGIIDRLLYRFEGMAEADRAILFDLLLAILHQPSTRRLFAIAAESLGLKYELSRYPLPQALTDLINYPYDSVTGLELDAAAYRLCYSTMLGRLQMMLYDFLQNHAHTSPEPIEVLSFSSMAFFEPSNSDAVEECLRKVDAELLDLILEELCFTASKVKSWTYDFKIGVALQSLTTHDHLQLATRNKLPIYPTVLQICNAKSTASHAAADLEFLDVHHWLDDCFKRSFESYTQSIAEGLHDALIECDPLCAADGSLKLGRSSPLAALAAKVEWASIGPLKLSCESELPSFVKLVAKVDFSGHKRSKSDVQPWRHLGQHSCVMLLHVGGRILDIDPNRPDLEGNSLRMPTLCETYQVQQIAVTQVASVDHHSFKKDSTAEVRLLLDPATFNSGTVKFSGVPPKFNLVLALPSVSSKASSKVFAIKELLSLSSVELPKLDLQLRLAILNLPYTPPSPSRPRRASFAYVFYSLEHAKKIFIGREHSLQVEVINDPSATDKGLLVEAIRCGDKLELVAKPWNLGFSTTEFPPKALNCNASELSALTAACFPGIHTVLSSTFGGMVNFGASLLRNSLLQREKTLVIYSHPKTKHALFAKLYELGVKPSLMYYLSDAATCSDTVKVAESIDCILARRLLLLGQVAELCKNYGASSVYADSCHNALSFYYEKLVSDENARSEHGRLFEEIASYIGLEVAGTAKKRNEHYFAYSASVVGVSVDQLFTMRDVYSGQAFVNLVVLDAYSIERSDVTLALLTARFSNWKSVVLVDEASSSADNLEGFIHSLKSRGYPVLQLK